jgi:predicted dehydrogenase
MLRRAVIRFAVVIILATAIGALAIGALANGALADEPLRVGILGIDNYQALAFTQLFHKPPADNSDLIGLKVVAAWPGGSPDFEETITDIERWRPRLIEQGVKIVESVDEVLEQSDVVMIMTIDGRAHLNLARRALTAKKPLYIGRPMAASLEDVIEMFQIAEETKTPLFSCSQHRYSPGFSGMRDHPEVGKVQGCNVYGGCPVVPHHGDFFGHVIHSIETLYTIMGPGVESVTRANTSSAESVMGVWKDGRIGTYRGIRTGAVKYSALVFGDKGVAPAGKYGYAAPVNGVVPKGRYMGYEGVATEMAKFYKTRKLPIDPSETIEIFAFMEAAHESKRRGGVPIKLDEVLSAAQKRVEQRASSLR